MVLPITQRPYMPPTEYFGQNGVGYRYPSYQKFYGESWRQKKPFTLWLPYASDTIWIEDFKSTRDNDWPSIGSFQPFDNSVMQLALGKALNKLQEDMQDPSMWAVNIKEYKEAFALITNDCATLLKATRQISRFDFFGAAKTLKTYVPKGLKKKAKSLGDNWLKFHFGIEPLMGDIWAATSVLNRAVPNRVLVGRGKSLVKRDTSEIGPNYGSIRRTLLTSKCRVAVEVRCNNPNVYLANQLGFVNPASFVWEVIPFSFVVDWFSNVGQFLGQFSMFAGLDVVNSTTYYLQQNDVEIGSYNFIWGPPIDFSLSYKVKYVYARRFGGIPLLTLKVYPWKSPSPVRAATAISLLVQHLKS